MWSRGVVLLLGLVWAAGIRGAPPEEFPRELVELEAHRGNPIFEGRGPGHWDAKIRERGWILRDEDGYHLWYTGYDGTREGIKMLGYATSPTGVGDWTRRPLPIYHEHWVEDMMVVRVGETYYMFAEGRGDRAHLLVSADGVHWVRRGPLDIRRVDGQPIAEGAYGTPTAWFEDGVWRLFYERGDRGVWLARSKDLCVWTNVQDEPVLVPGPGDHERDLVALNQILRYQGRYYAYYHGRGARPEWSTNLAVSTDLVRWTKYSRNPLLAIEANESSGIVVHDGVRFRLYTMHDRVRLYFGPPAEPPR